MLVLYAFYRNKSNLNLVVFFLFKKCNDSLNLQKWDTEAENPDAYRKEALFSRPHDFNKEEFNSAVVLLTIFQA